jgi:copper(I)-binding protein
MSLKNTLLAAGAAVAFALPAFAGSVISIEDAYARAAGATAVAGAAFFVIHNTGDEDDRLVAAESDIAKRVELHTHIAGDDGVMKMVEVPEGFPVPAGGMHMLQRGGDHVMFMGLNAPLEQGDTVNVTLVFEQAGRIDVAIPVDNERAPAMQMEGMQMEGMSD